MEETQIQKIAGDARKAANLHSVKVGDDEYTIVLLPATRALEVSQQLFQTFLPALGSIYDGQSREGLVLPEEESMWTEISLLLTKQMSKADLIGVIKSLLTETTCNSKVIDFESHFAGGKGLARLAIVVEFAMKENFGDFFTDYLKAKGFDLPSLRQTMQEPTSAASEEQ